VIVVEPLRPGEGEGVAALPVKVRRLRFPNQATQVLFLRQMVEQYRSNEMIRQKAHDIVFEWADCEERARACQALAIAAWVQQHIRYVNEGVETFQSPVRTLTYRHGDCDDFTSLICSLLESIAIPSELVGLEWKVGGESQYRHIFPRAVVQAPDGRTLRIPLDATLRTDVGKLTNPIEILIRQGKQPRALVL
jgi:hypothetical protein